MDHFVVKSYNLFAVEVLLLLLLFLTLALAHKRWGARGLKTRHTRPHEETEKNIGYKTTRKRKLNEKRKTSYRTKREESVEETDQNKIKGERRALPTPAYNAGGFRAGFPPTRHPPPCTTPQGVQQDGVRKTNTYIFPQNKKSKGNVHQEYQVLQQCSMHQYISVG